MTPQNWVARSIRFTSFGLVAAAMVACGGGGGGGSPAPTVTSMGVDNLKYSQQAVVTLNGTNLDADLTVASAGCSSMTRSTTAPFVSTATTAYYTCTVSAIGAQTFTATRTSTSASLFSGAFDVPAPQVTMTVSDGVNYNASMVITLAPDKTPITVNNFLKYVNDGYYTGTIFHRVVAGFVIQGGGYLPITTLPPVAKSGLRAPIALEVNKGLSNLQWTIAMARTNVADSATSQFFINLVNNASSLDPGPTAGYAVFGTVTTNTALVQQIVAAPCTPIAGFSECTPNSNAVITAATQTR